MRVLHLTTEFPPVIYGGLGTAVGGWVNASAKLGVAVAVQLVEGDLQLSGYGALRCFSGAEEVIIGEHGVPFFRSPWSNAIQLGIRAVRTWGADILHLHTAMLWDVAKGIHAATHVP